MNGFNTENMNVCSVDMELLENYDFSISDVRNEKRNLIKNTIIERIGILNNLINDIDYIKNENMPTYLSDTINKMLYYLITNDIDNLLKLIDKFINKRNLDKVIKTYNEYELDYKKLYLKKLNNAKNIKFE